MKTKSLVKWLVLIFMMVLSGRVPVFSQNFQLQGDTLIRVPDSTFSGERQYIFVSAVLYNSSGQQIGEAIHIDHIRGTVLQEIKLSGNLTSGMYYIHGIVSETGKAVKYNLTSKLLFLGRGWHN